MKKTYEELTEELLQIDESIKDCEVDIRYLSENPKFADQLEEEKRRLEGLEKERSKIISQLN